MPVDIFLRRGKHRIIDLQTGMPAVDEKGAPIDEGGRRGKFKPASLKLKAIEINEAERDV